jgi:hypothetical protein
LDRVGDWAAFLGAGLSDVDAEAIRAGERTCRPLGSPEFVAQLEGRPGRASGPSCWASAT